MKIDSPLILTELNVSGSTSFTGSLTIDGTISASAGVAGTAETASYVEFNNVDGLPNFSSSVDSRITAQENFSSSLDTTFATDSELSLVSSSFDTRVTTVESDIDAVEVRAGLLESATASLDGRLASVETTTASLETRAGLLESATASLDGRLDSVENTTSSLVLQVSSLQAETGSYATTGSNTFTGNNTFTVSQSISDTTNSTNYTEGALTIAGGLGVGKDVNISGSLTLTGLLTAISMSTQYVTSSQYTIGTSRVIVNDDDLIRFAGLSVRDSGSTAYTGSLLWDSLRNHWLYENESGSSYNSALIIAGPKNTGSLGNEVGLTTNRVPVATGEDHIDTSPSISPLRIDGGDFHVEDDMVVSGSVTTSGAATLNSTLSVSGDANFDSGTLFVDVSENKVGINTTSPGTPLHVTSGTDYSTIRMSRSNSANTLQRVGLVYPNYANDAEVGLISAFDGFGISGVQIGGAPSGWVGTSPTQMVFVTTATYGTLGSERMRIDSSGNVGIGTTSPSGRLHVASTDIDLYLTGTRGTDNTYSIKSSGTNAEFLEFADVTASNRMYLLGKDSHQWYISGSERMRITSDGYLRMASGTGGIQFNGDTAATNALDDYEEGTFTPTITVGVTSPSYGVQSGQYTKIGNVVYIRIGISLSAGTATTGHLTIAGLPFSPTTSTALGLGECNSSFFNSTSTNRPDLQVESSPIARFYKTDASDFRGTDMNSVAGALIIASGFYYV